MVQVVNGPLQPPKGNVYIVRYQNPLHPNDGIRETTQASYAVCVAVAQQDNARQRRRGLPDMATVVYVGGPENG